MENPWHIANTQRLGCNHNSWFRLEVFIIGQSGPRRDDVILGQAFQLRFIGEFPMDEFLGNSGLLGAFWNGHNVTANEGGLLAFLDAGQNRHTEIQVCSFFLQ